MTDKEYINKLKQENKALKNRCFVFTRGLICDCCNIEACKNRTKEFVNPKD